MIFSAAKNSARGSIVQAWIVGLIGVLAVASSVLPYIVIKGFSHPFLTPRELALRTCALLLAPLLATEWVMRGAPHRLGILGKAVVGVCLAAAISTIFSVDPHTSFWGYAERLTGFITIVEVVVLGLAYRVVFCAGVYWRRTLLISLGVSWAGVAVWAVAERLVPGFWWQFNGGGGRSVSVFGNSIFLANGLLVGLFLFLSVISAVWSGRRRWIAAAVVAGLGLWAIFSTETRGAFVGLAAGVFVAIEVTLFSSGIRWARRVGVVLPLLAVVGIGGMWLARDVSLPAFTPSPLTRAMTLFSTTDPSRLQRFQLWRVGWQSFIQRPFTGWGLEQFDTALDRVFDPYITRYGIANAYSDRVHNGFLDVAAVAGIVGLSAFLFLLYAIIRTIYDVRRAKNMSLCAAACAYGGVAAYGAALITSFDTQSTFLLLALAVAVLSWFRLSSVQASSPPKSMLLWSGTGVVVAGMSLWMLLYGVIPVIRGSGIVNRAVVTERSDELLTAARTIVTFEQPYRAHYELRIANEIFKAVGDATPRGNQPEVLLRQAELLLRDARTRRPKHFATVFTLANILLLQATHGMIPVSDAKAMLLEARLLSPRRQISYYQMGNAYLVEGDIERSLQEFEAALALHPDVPESMWNVALARARIGDWEVAGSLYQKAWEMSFGRDRSSNEYGQAINALLQTGKFELAYEVYEHWVDLYPPTADILASYAALSAELGYREEALSILRRAVNLDATLMVEVPDFLARYGFPPDAISSNEGHP